MMVERFQENGLRKQCWRSWITSALPAMKRRKLKGIGGTVEFFTVTIWCELLSTCQTQLSIVNG